MSTTVAYLDLDGFKSLSLLPADTIDRIDVENPGFFAATLLERSSWLNSRLRKQYAAPFQQPYPPIVQGWLARIVTWRATFKSGYQPTDVSATELKDDALAAEREITEAASATDGLFDLPLRDDQTASGITKNATRVYSERSPYVSASIRGTTGRDEDLSGQGTTQ